MTGHVQPKRLGESVEEEFRMSSCRHDGMIGVRSFVNTCTFIVRSWRSSGCQDRVVVKSGSDANTFPVRI